MMLKVEKVPPPHAAGSVVVPARVAPLGLVPSATVTDPVKPVATFPSASSAVTTTAGLSARPATALVGCAVNTSCVTVAAVMVKGVLVAGVRVPDAAASV